MKPLTAFASFTIVLASASALLAEGFDLDGNIDQQTVTKDVEGDIHITGKIDGGSHVVLISEHGSIFIDGKIDGGSHVTLKAAQDIEIGRKGDAENKKIDGGSQVDATAGGAIKIGNRIDGGSWVHLRAATGIDIADKIDNGSTQVFLKTDTGKLEIHDKIDGGATVVYWPSAAILIDNPSKNANMLPSDW